MIGYCNTSFKMCWMLLHTCARVFCKKSEACWIQILCAKSFVKTMCIIINDYSYHSTCQYISSLFTISVPASNFWRLDLDVLRPGQFTCYAWQDIIPHCLVTFNVIYILHFTNIIPCQIEVKPVMFVVMIWWTSIFISAVGVFKKGWDEIPEVVATTALAVFGLSLGAVGLYKYYSNDGDNRRYKCDYVGKQTCWVRVSISYIFKWVQDS
jgi:hypothetical protein